MKVLLALVLCMQQNVLGQKYDPSCECGVEGKSRRIVGGTETQPHQYPWIVALMMGSRPMCGGSIITNKHILTAGHCVTDGINYTDLKAFIGMHDLNGESHTVMKIVNGVIHPGFDTNVIRDINDIAVLTTEKTINFNSKASPICLPTKNTKFNKLFTVAGWGQTDPHDPESKSRYLLQAQVEFVPSSKCMKIKHYKDNLVPETMMCAYASGIDVCEGDSGGPLFARPQKSPRNKFYQAGITSWGGISCAQPNKPGVYTIVAKYIPWIKQQTKSGTYCRK